MQQRNDKEEQLTDFLELQNHRYKHRILAFHYFSLCFVLFNEIALLSNTEYNETVNCLCKSDSYE